MEKVLHHHVWRLVQDLLVVRGHLAWAAGARFRHQQRFVLAFKRAQRSIPVAFIFVILSAGLTDGTRVTLRNGTVSQRSQETQSAHPPL